MNGTRITISLMRWLRPAAISACVLIPVVPATAGMHLALADTGPKYTVQDLGTLGSNWIEPFSINTAGNVAGYAGDGFYWDGTQLNKIGDSGAYWAQALNNSNTVVGYGNAGFNTVAFSYTTGGGLKNYPAASPNTGSIAYGVNDTNVMVGVLTDQNFNDHAASYDINGTGTWNLVPDLGGSTSTAFAINKLGEIVGQAALQSAPSKHHAFIGGSAQIPALDLGTFGGDNSYALAVNEHGVVVGAAQDSSGTYQWFVSDPSVNGGKIKGVDAGRFQGSMAEGINSKGQIVGTEREQYPRNFHKSEANGEALLFQSGQTYYLQNLVPSNYPCTLTNAYSINDSGQITATADCSSGSNPGIHGVILNPVPQPANAPASVQFTPRAVPATAPDNSFAVSYDSPLTLTAAASDTEAADTLSWTSIDGLPAGMTHTALPPPKTGKSSVTVSGTGSKNAVTSLPGSYSVNFKVSDGHSNTTQTASITVSKQPVSFTSVGKPLGPILVSGAAATSGLFTLKAKLSAHGPASSAANLPISMTLTRVVSNGNGSVPGPVPCVVSGKAGSSSLVATCSSNKVPVGVYDVSLAIGASNFFTGRYDTVLTVVDTKGYKEFGGGSFSRKIAGKPVVGDFGFLAATCNGGATQGGYAYVEHRAAGDVVTTGSSPFSSCSLAKNKTATLRGLATRSDLAGSLDSVLTAIPGTGPSSKFGLQLKAGSTGTDIFFAPLAALSGSSIKTG
ncbi:MAG: hypothetical protein NVSMB52_12190 [Chloroflexota bacterium]